MEALAQIDFRNRDGSIFIDAKNAVYTVKIIVTSNGLVIVGLELQGIAILLGGLSAYSIWLTLKAMSLANQASVSESPASQSFEILRYIADDPQLYEYFYKNKALQSKLPHELKSSAMQKSWLTFVSTLFSRGRVFLLHPTRHGCAMSGITTRRVVLSTSLLPNTVTGMPIPS